MCADVLLDEKLICTGTQQAIRQGIGRARPYRKAGKCRASDSCDRVHLIECGLKYETMFSVEGQA